VDGNLPDGLLDELGTRAGRVRDARAASWTEYLALAALIRFAESEPAFARSRVAAQTLREALLEIFDASATALAEDFENLEVCRDELDKIVGFLPRTATLDFRGERLTVAEHRDRLVARAALEATYGTPVGSPLEREAAETLIEAVFSGLDFELDPSLGGGRFGEVALKTLRRVQSDNASTLGGSAETAQLIADGTKGMVYRRRHRWHGLRKRRQT
jgi:hypothetical protein